MRKMDIFDISGILAITGATLISSALILLAISDYILTHKSDESQINIQSLDDTGHNSNTYDYIGKDAEVYGNVDCLNVGIGYGTHELKCNTNNATVIGFGEPGKIKTMYKPIELEEWQIILIDEAKKKGHAGIILDINNNPTYISFHGHVGQTTGSYNSAF